MSDGALFLGLHSARPHDVPRTRCPDPKWSLHGMLRHMRCQFLRGLFLCNDVLYSGCGPTSSLSPCWHGRGGRESAPGTSLAELSCLHQAALPFQYFVFPRIGHFMEGVAELPSHLLQHMWSWPSRERLPYHRFDSCARFSQRYCVALFLLPLLPIMDG